MDSTVCSYSDLSDQQRVLVADGSCGTAATCLLDRNCAITIVMPVNATRFDLESHWLIGDLSRYPHDTLELAQLQSLTGLHTFFQLPVTLRALSLVNSTFQDPAPSEYFAADSLQVLQLPRAIESVTLHTCILQGNVRFPGLRNLQRLEVRRARFDDIWLRDVRDTLRHLVLDNIALTGWTKQSLSLPLHRLQTLELAGVRTSISQLDVSSELRYFACDDCDISSLIVDNTTYAALAALAPASPNATKGYRVSGIHQDASACAIEHGHVQILWRTSSVCIPDRSNTVDVYGGSYSFRRYPQYYVGGGVILFCVLFFAICIIRRGRRAVKSRRSADDDYLALTLGSSELDTLQMLQIDADAIVLCGTKPLASGAYGDVWRGIYAHTTVALKRVKTRHVSVG
ncbi:hypothetical protein SDRG_14549 [Saprolegnia diclina VS20]|uniref:Uncharacterized protein n=1 Tax=Saprolegnia diclina (strain VS20) TaxID=1156394 RepID=T0PQ83_SAPDV|nr:hypothetical protein SDRG_14549 [Saprolegnia diclina VS20]EQC27639.1 hypothetical protein SDRG_14549 [Saprolegnia diclina VS20]|eukprot:XP_008618907.1 hypothetical protein SDRG_14549 [Saprolegnia diclina VS20]